MQGRAATQRAAPVASGLRSALQDMVKPRRVQVIEHVGARGRAWTCTQGPPWRFADMARGDDGDCVPRAPLAAAAPALVRIRRARDLSEWPEAMLLRMRGAFREGASGHCASIFDVLLHVQWHHGVGKW